VSQFVARSLPVPVISRHAVRMPKFNGRESASHSTPQPCTAQLNSRARFQSARAGFTPSGAPVQKICGAPNIRIPPSRLPSPDTYSSHHQHFVEEPCCNVHYYCSSSCLWQFALLLGPPFCGAPVRPNMLNMPKSASAISRCVHTAEATTVTAVKPTASQSSGSCRPRLVNTEQPLT